MKIGTPHEVIVTECEEGKLTQLVQVDTHTFYADEPKEFGGNNKGPNPHELLLASLGACGSMTMRLYAKEKNIPLKGIRITLTRKKVYNENLSKTRDKSEESDLIYMTIYLTGDLTAEQEKALLNIAEKCPLHKTLTHPSIIKITLGKKQ